jgi:HAE1 family hydrophobic/amphiphilic exporter-1
MSFTELFIRRPVMTTLVMAGILIFGLVAYRALPVSDLPAVDYPTISVSASLPGASPETMASSVATPLERQFSTISGLAVISSTSTLGNTSITLEFEQQRDIDSASSKPCPSPEITVSVPARTSRKRPCVRWASECRS